MPCRNVIVIRRNATEAVAIPASALGADKRVPLLVRSGLEFD